MGCGWVLAVRTPGHFPLARLVFLGITGHFPLPGWFFQALRTGLRTFVGEQYLVLCCELTVNIALAFCIRIALSFMHEYWLAQSV